jgi:hypothetical protein
LLTLPSLAHAQRGGRKSRGGDDANVSKGPIKPKRDQYSSKELQKENMVNFILDKKKDLKLSDDEVKALKEINDHLKDTTKAQLKSLDSLANEIRYSGQEDAAGRIFGAQFLADVRRQYDEHLQTALAKLTEDQQKAANALIETRRQELAKEKEKDRDR